MSKTCKNYDFCTKLKSQFKHGLKADNFNPPIGYNPLEKIRGALNWWVPVHFNGVPVWVKLRCLNALQQQACGEFTTIDVRTEKEKKSIQITKGLLINEFNKWEALTQAALVYPSFDEIVKLITKEDFSINENKKEIEALKNDIEKMNKKDKKYKEYKNRIDFLEIQLGYLLPVDFMADIAAWATGAEITDAKLLSRKLLLQAAMIAVNGHKEPTDEISGIFSDKQKTEINKAAWVTYNEYMQDKQAANEIKRKNYKW